MENPGAPAAHAFSDADRAAVYQAIYSRRDVRGQFLPDPVADDVLGRVLLAAHHAPSVGFMQPWNFLVVRSPAVQAARARRLPRRQRRGRTALRRTRSAPLQQPEARGNPRIADQPVHHLRPQPHGPVVIGRTHIGAMDLYSAVCAVQNLWLAARAEGLGVGWVSILHQQALRDALGIPHEIVPIAYLCIGWVSHFNDRPELETCGWLPRLPLAELLHYEQWGSTTGTPPDEALTAAVSNLQDGLQRLPRQAA
jgi:5,6-dimethylbenzimidazole synthase